MRRARRVVSRPIPLLLMSLVFVVPCLNAAEEKPVLFAGKPPTEVYRIVHRAKRNVDADTVLACTSRRARATPRSVYEGLMRNRSTLPERIDVLKSDVRSPMAMLIIRGRHRDRETGDMVTSRGTVTMLHEDGTWRIRHEAWEEVGRERLPVGAVREEVSP